MEFLGDSQTFLGVISSFLVLCIVINESNFIYNIISVPLKWDELNN